MLNCFHQTWENIGGKLKWKIKVKVSGFQKNKIKKTLKVLIKMVLMWGVNELVVNPNALIQKMLVKDEQ